MSLTVFSIFILLIQLSNGNPLSTENLSQYFPRIIGGDEVGKGDAPYMAALVISEFLTMLVCGGSIVTFKHILTAAHCIEAFVIWGELPPSYRAKVGTTDWYHHGAEASISSFHIHPLWDQEYVKNDVGILEVVGEFELGKNVAVMPMNFDYIGGGEKAQVTGWGRLGTWGITPFKLQTLVVITLSHDQCVEDLLGSPFWGVNPPTLQEDVEICTFHSDNHGICHGDSGSPLMQPDLEQQVGVVSWGYPCGRGLPDVHVRLSGVKEFILRILKGYFVD